MKEEIQELKLKTMRPHILAEQMIVDIEAMLMFGSPKGFEREMLLKQLNSHKMQLAVELL